MSSAWSEYEVENMLISRLIELRYEYVHINNYNDVKDNFRKQFCKLNEKKLIEAKGEAVLSDLEFDRVLLRLENHSIYESAKLLRETWILELDNGKDAYVDFLTNDDSLNSYQVAHQITMDPAHKNDVEYKNRYDVTILINGLPLVQIELKKPGIDLDEAINQINRYRRFSFKGLFKYIQIFVVSNSTQTKYFANVNDNYPDGSAQHVLKSLTFYWTDEENARIPKLLDFTNSFLTRFHITEMLTKYFVIKSSEPMLMVMRPYQIYAVRGCYNRVISSNKNGYVWHCTGSGKTLSSFKLATLLRDESRIDKCIMLLDRLDLDDQTVDEYNSFEEGCVDQTENTKVLVDDLQDDTKTLIITTIQKLASALRIEKYSSPMEKLKNKRIVFIIDECHRSQFGKMHTAIEKHFTNANYIGFTGTPIFPQNKAGNGRTTADLFATHSKNLNACIATYPIKNAIADGNVLKFSVEFLKSINKFKLGGVEYDEKVLDDANFCRKHGINIEEIYHDEKRIKYVADDILSHLEQHTHPAGKDIYTAIFATDYIATLLQYFEYMTKPENNPKGYKIAAIFRCEPNDDMDEGITEHSLTDLKKYMDYYNKMFNTDFTPETFDGYRKDISNRLKQRETPQIDILLVVDMFLTGFDSKPTNTLILDKNLVWHSLLQAYSRTNRVDKLTKQFGQIITYRNIKKAQDDALQLFSGGGDPNEFLLENYDYYLAAYRKHVESLRDVCKTADDAAYLDDEDEQKKYILSFRNVAHTLAVLKTFTKFEWKDLDIFLDEKEYMDYKSWYLTFYDNNKRSQSQGIFSALNDIDFKIELVRTDKINVVYILNLLKDINKSNPKKRQEAIDLILQEIERSDNKKLRSKRELLKQFVTERFFNLDPNLDISEAYAEFENQKMQQEIGVFAAENEIKEEIINSIVCDYLVDQKKITKELIRQKIAYLNLGLLKTTTIITKILFFIDEMYNKYTVEEY